MNVVKVNNRILKTNSYEQNNNLLLSNSMFIFIISFLAEMIDELTDALFLLFLEECEDWEMDAEDVEGFLGLHSGVCTGEGLSGGTSDAQLRLSSWTLGWVYCGPVDVDSELAYWNSSEILKSIIRYWLIKATRSWLIWHNCLLQNV